MTGCSALGCSNRSDRGFTMKVFPRDPERRAQWIAKVKRKDWKPSEKACLCEAHFEPNQWEKTRVDGSRKLKSSAVPTLFWFASKTQKEKHSKKRGAPSKTISSACPSIPINKFEENVTESKPSTIVSSPESSNILPSAESSNILPSPESLNILPSPESSNILPSPESLNILPSPESLNIIPILKYEEIKTEPYSPDPLNILPSPESSCVEPKTVSLNSVPSPDSSNTKDKYIKQLEDKIAEYDKHLGRQDKVIADLRKKARYNVIRKYKDKVLAKKNIVKNILHDDQLKVLGNKSSCGIKWSDATIKSALELKFSCGDSGYSCLLKQNIPLPSTRTISRRLENLKFESGILEEVIDFLQIKTVNMKEHEKECVLVLDKMAITANVEYDTSTDDLFGEVTLPKHNGAGTHALVFMLGGITSRWKQTVAYYLTGNAVDGSVLKDVSLEILIKVEKIGLKVVCISSDMDAANQGMWKEFGIIGSTSKSTCSIAHPCDQARKLNFLPDVPHLFKNIREAVISREVIEISEEIQCKFNLPTKTVAAEHLLLIDFHDQNVKKKTVNQARQVIRHDTPYGLKFLAKESNDPGLLTSTWFLGIVEKWFELMTSTHPVTALSLLNKKVYREKIQFLKNVVEIFETMRVGNTGYWKSVQTGVIMATTSMLEIQHSFLQEKNCKFLLTSRFSRDRIDNLFSCGRHKQIVPNALQFKNNLKLICIAQYLKNTSLGNYDQDDREFLSGFLLDAIKAK